MTLYSPIQYNLMAVFKAASADTATSATWVQTGILGVCVVAVVLAFRSRFLRIGPDVDMLQQQWEREREQWEREREGFGTRIVSLEDQLAERDRVIEKMMTTLSNAALPAIRSNTEVLRGLPAQESEMAELRNEVLAALAEMRRLSRGS